MAANIVSVPHALADHIDEQRTLVSDALAVIDVTIATIHETREGEPEVRGALCVARRLLEEATEGLDSVNIERAAAEAA